MRWNPIWRRRPAKQFRWMIACPLCLALSLCLVCFSASADERSAFDYLTAYHDAATDAEKDALVLRAYQAKGDEPLRLALEMLYAGPFPSDFSEPAMEDFIDRFSQIMPPDASYLSTLPDGERQKAQVIMSMAGIGYEELFTLNLMDKVEQSPNTVVRLWLEEDLAAWPKAVPHLALDEEPGFLAIAVPDERIDADIPWGFAMQPDDALSVQAVFVGERKHDGSPYYQLQLDMLALAPEAVRAADPWKAKYVVVICKKTEKVGSYTNGKGAYRHDLIAEIYKVATGEVMRSTVHHGSEPPAFVTNDDEGHGALPDRAEVFTFVMNDFVRTFVEKII